MEQFVSGEISPEGKAMLIDRIDDPQYSEKLNAILRENYDTLEIPTISDQETKKFIEKLWYKINDS